VVWTIPSPWRVSAVGAARLADAAFAANLDFKDRFAQPVIESDLHIAKLKLPGLIGPEAAIDHEQDKVVELFALPFVSDLARILRAFAYNTKRVTTV